MDLVYSPWIYSMIFQLKNNSLILKIHWHMVILQKHPKLYIVLLLLLPHIIILFLHLLSTNHKYTQPCYFLLLLKPAAQKEKMSWNSSTRNSRLHVASFAVLVELLSLPLFCFIESRHSL
jgi:hypothetical protein